MEVKIKQGNEMLDATIEMVEGVMVVSPKEVKFKPKEMKFKPKDGDVCSTTYCVYIYKSLRDDKAIIYYCAMTKNGGHITIKEDVGVGFIHNGCHYFATEEEKKKLFDKLAEEGYEWKADTKELVKLKWKPGMYDPYYSPFYDTCEFIPMGTNWNGRNKDNIRYNKGLCFKTEEECQEFCNRLNDAINQVKP